MPKSVANVRPLRRVWRYTRRSVTVLILLMTAMAWVRSEGRLILYSGAVGVIRSGRTISVQEQVTACNGGVGISLFRYSWPMTSRHPIPLGFSWNKSVAPADPLVYPNQGLLERPGIFYGHGLFSLSGLGFVLYRQNFEVQPPTAPPWPASLSVTTVTLPFGFVLAISAIAPAIWSIRFLRRKLRGPMRADAVEGFEVVNSPGNSFR